MRAPGASACTAPTGSAERLVNTRISERAERRPSGAARVHFRDIAPVSPGGGDREPARKPAWRRQPRRNPQRVVPKHVDACAKNQWAIFQWQHTRAEKVTRRPYRCNCWRHDGECARREAAVTFARIKEACERPELAPDGWIFFVLTLDRNGVYSGSVRWSDTNAAFRELSAMSRNFMARVNRLCRRNGWEVPSAHIRAEKPIAPWVSTVEAHRSGWPHVNVTLYCPELAAELEGHRRVKLKKGLARLGLDNSERVLKLSRKQRRESFGALSGEQKRALDELERQAILLDGELLEAAMGTNWGRMSTAERVADRDALASYIVKLAGEADDALERVGAELSKLTQRPVNAPQRFRRLRSGKGFLPPRRKNPEITGTLMRREYDPDRSAYGALPLHKCKTDAQRDWFARLARIEGDRMLRESAARQFAREKGLDYKDCAPPVVEQYLVRGDDFIVLGERMVSDDGVFSDADGWAKWAPALESPGGDDG